MAAVLLVVQGVGVFRSQADISNQRPLPEASIAPSSISTGPPLPTAAQATCETNYPPCQHQIVELWRLQMRDIIVDYLDPGGSYFASEFVRIEDPIWRYTTGTVAFWRWGSPEAPAGERSSGSRLPPRAEYATPCGDQTGQSCFATVLDGNRVLVTESSSTAQGLEVQDAPYDEVITLIGRESGKGKTLPINRG